MVARVPDVVIVVEIVEDVDVELLKVEALLVAGVVVLRILEVLAEVIIIVENRVDDGGEMGGSGMVVGVIVKGVGILEVLAEVVVVVDDERETVERVGVELVGDPVMHVTSD